jgi:hypothetical protein
MQTRYRGLPAAATVEQAIILAQRLIVKDLELRRKGSPRALGFLDPGTFPPRVSLYQR